MRLIGERARSGRRGSALLWSWPSSSACMSWPWRRRRPRRGAPGYDAYEARAGLYAYSLVTRVGGRTAARRTSLFSLDAETGSGRVAATYHPPFRRPARGPRYHPISRVRLGRCGGSPRRTMASRIAARVRSSRRPSFSGSPVRSATGLDGVADDVAKGRHYRRRVAIRMPGLKEPPTSA